MRIIPTVAIFVLFTAGSLAHARDIKALQNLSQDQFDAFALDLVSALSYKATSPAEPLGTTGFDLGVGVSLIELQQPESWKIAAGSSAEYLPVPRISLTKGLPLRIDVGAFVAAVPSSNIMLYGGELKYALIGGNPVLPAVAVRGGYTRLSGVDQLALETRSLELTVSKGLFAFTPYAGIGRVWGDVRPDAISRSGTALTSSSPSRDRVFAGLQFSLLIGSFALEVDKTGDTLGASTKLGLRF